MTTLSELTQQLTELVYMEEHLDPQTYSDTLEGVEGAFEVKAEKVVYAIQGIAARAEMMKEQAKRFRERIATIESNAEYLRMLSLRCPSIPHPGSVGSGTHRGPRSVMTRRCLCTAAMKGRESINVKLLKC